MPNFCSPSSASPESFSTTRAYLAFVWTAIGGSLGRFAVRLAQLEPLEPSDADVFTRRRGDPGHEVADFLRRVADVHLLEQLVDVLRIHRGDLHRELLGELLEIRVARHEVGLARELHHRADPAARVDVGFDEALLGLTIGLFLRLLEAAVLDERPCLLEVAPGLLKSALAVHDACA